MVKNTLKKQEWLLFFYSVPSKPVNSRMKIWRMLVRAGAVQFKGSGYILPATDDHFEFFQWLVTSVTAMQGEAAFVKVSSIETMKDSDIIALFDRQREKDYLDLNKRLDGFAAKVGRKGNVTLNSKKMHDELNRFLKEFSEIGKVDFFSSKGRKETEERFNALTAELTGMMGAEAGQQALEVKRRDAADYLGKRWVTRKRPFIDRFASAWLIKGFIDKKATFGFIDDNEIEGLDRDTVSFDMVGAEFTHIGDMCTFEVLLKSFALKDKTLGIVAEIIHQLDLQDDKYRNPAAEGLREILDGIRRTVGDDHDALEKGMGIFDMLYAANR